MSRREYQRLSFVIPLTSKGYVCTNGHLTGQIGRSAKDGDCAMHSTGLFEIMVFDLNESKDSNPPCPLAGAFASSSHQGRGHSPHPIDNFFQSAPPCRIRRMSKNFENSPKVENFKGKCNFFC